MYHQALISPSRWGLLRRAIGFALVWCLAFGTVFIPGVWAATYYVDTGGDDGNSAAQAQSPATPWKTLTHALGEVTDGDDILVAAGTYDSTLGEVFPLTLVDGVALQGAGPATTISGPPASVLFRNADTPLASGTTLSGFTLTHEASSSANIGMSFTLASAAMAPQITDNNFAGLTDKGYGINVVDSGSDPRSFTAVIEGNTFSNWYRGVMATFTLGGEQSELSPIISGNSFDSNDKGVLVDVDQAGAHTSSPVVSDNQITNSVGHGVTMYLDLYGSNAHGTTFEPLISGNTVTGSGSSGIYLSVSYLSLSSTSEVTTFSPTVLNNVIDDANTDGIEVFYYNSSANSSLVSSVTIAGNTITNVTSTGIDISGATWSYGTFNMDLDLTVINNTITTSYGGVDLEFSDTVYYASGDIDITVAGNTITNTTGPGIEIDLSSISSTCVFDFALHVNGNVVTDSGSNGVELDVKYQQGFSSSSIEVTNNVVAGSGLDGLDLSFQDFPSPTAYAQLACNSVSNSTGWDVKLFNDVDAPPPDFGGGGDLMSLGLNSLTSATAFYNYEQIDDVDAHSNWWGTTDDATIDSHIFDDDEASPRSAVLYSGWLSGPPTVSATATLVDALEVDLLPPGPSTGDTIRYTATLQGTGECGCAAALFTVPIPDNGTFIPDSLAASRGILINESVSTLHPELIVGLGVLGATETVTITWDVMAGGGCCMTSQATLSCYQLGEVLTDDPDVGGGSDPTTIVLNLLFGNGFESGDTDLWSDTVP